MYIIYDARHLEDYYSGLSRYSFSVLKELILDDEYIKLEIILNKNYDYELNPLFQQLSRLLNEKIDLVYLNAPIFSLKHNITIANYVNSTDCDLYFYPHFDMPVFIKRKTIFVIHDLFPLVLDDYVLKNAWLKKLYFKIIIYVNLMKKNSHCIAVSKSTKQDILDFFGTKFDKQIAVIYEDSFSDEQEEQNREELELPSIVFHEKYLFYIGGRRKHKNLKRMIDIFQNMIETKQFDGYFIIAGSKRNFDFDVEKYIENKKRIVTLGPVSDAELNILYEKMEALFFLSTYEGFGLPIIEAAKYNKKIITSALGACDEIAPPSSLIIDISDENIIIVEQVIKYLDDAREIDNERYLEHFSWRNIVMFLTSYIER